MAKYPSITTISSDGEGSFQSLDPEGVSSENECIFEPVPVCTDTWKNQSPFSPPDPGCMHGDTSETASSKGTSSSEGSLSLQVDSFIEDLFSPLNVAQLSCPSMLSVDAPLLEPTLLTPSTSYLQAQWDQLLIIILVLHSQVPHRPNVHIP